MPRRSWLDLVWPISGISRSTAYQSQPPYTTPDAVNVRTEDMSEYRERGGSRPGLGLAIRDQLDGPVRLLTKVGVLRAEWPKNYSPVKAWQLDSQMETPVWSSAPTFNEGPLGYQAEGAYLDGTDWGVWFPADLYAKANTSTQPYQAYVFLKPPPGELLLGTAKIFVGLDPSATDPREDSMEITLTFSSGSYQCTAINWVSGLSNPGFVSATYTQDAGQPGSFIAKYNPNTGNVQVYWRRQLLGSTSILSPGGNRFAFEFTSSTNVIRASKFALDFQWQANEVRDYRDLRRDVLVAVSEGDIWVEDTADSLRKVVTDGLSPTAELTAAEREQLLYIADYGAALSGEASGTIASGSYNTLQDAAYDFAALGIDSNYAVQLSNSNYSQNEKQTVTIYGSPTGGTFRLGFQGAFTSPLAYNVSFASMETALEGLSTIGAGNVSVTGSNPWTVEFTGDLAATDLQLLVARNIDLTGASTQTLEVTSSQDGAGGDYILGTYSITGAVGDTITFDPGITVSPDWGATDILNVTYNVVRAPKVFDPKAETLIVHSATVGNVPAGCRLVCRYRDRIVYAASDLEPHVWYMSRQGDPNDWDYSQEDSQAAIFSQPSVAGNLADPITALIPHGDECLIVGAYNSLWIIRGDPGYGGTQDQLSRKIGIVSSGAWCRTPDDMCVFLSPDGLYVMPAGCHGFPTSLSRERLPSDLIGLTQERQVIKLEYDTIHRGIHIFVTMIDGSRADHWFFDWEAKSFWRVRLQSDHEPYSLHERVAWDDTPIVLLGGRDGYIRYFHRDFEADDQDNPIESYCLLGPFHLDRGGYFEGVLTALTATLGADSGPVNWEVLVGDSAEQATRAAARENGTWSRGGLNYRTRPRARGVAACVKVSNGSTGQRWFLEKITAAIRSAGQRRVR